MFKKIITVFFVGCVLDLFALFVYTNGAEKGSYFFLGYLFSLCTLVVFNTFFFYLLHVFRLIDLSKISIPTISIISFITIIIPSLVHTFLCKYYYDFTFDISIYPDGTLYNKHVIWSNPLVLHLYNYLIIVVYYFTRKIYKRYHNEDRSPLRG